MPHPGYRRNLWRHHGICGLFQPFPPCTGRGPRFVFLWSAQPVSAACSTGRSRASLCYWIDGRSITVLTSLLVPVGLLLLALAVLLGGRIGQILAILAAVCAGVAVVLTLT